MPKIVLPPSSALGDKFGTLAKYRKSAHRGTDWALPEKTVIGAFADGKIEKIFWSDVLGWVVVQSIAGTGFYIGYCHLAAKPSSIKEGMEVLTGRAIGRVGNTGSASTGAHLHVTLSKTVMGVVSGAVYDILKYAQKWNKK